MRVLFVYIIYQLHLYTVFSEAKAHPSDILANAYYLVHIPKDGYIEKFTAHFWR